MFLFLFKKGRLLQASSRHQPLDEIRDEDPVPFALEQQAGRSSWNCNKRLSVASVDSLMQPVCHVAS